MEHGPRCRLCGYQLKASSGCAVCLEVKPNLVWPAVEEAASELSAQEVINDTLRMIKRRVRKLNKAITAEKGYDGQLTRDVASLARTLKELAAEQRKLEDREEEHFAGLGIEGRISLYVDHFFARLPEDFQLQLLVRMRDVLSTQAASLLPPEEKSLTAHSESPDDEA